MATAPLLKWKTVFECGSINQMAMTTQENDKLAEKRTGIFMDLTFRCTERQQKTFKYMFSQSDTSLDLLVVIGNIPDKFLDRVARLVERTVIKNNERNEKRNPN